MPRALPNFLFKFDKNLKIYFYYIILIFSLAISLIVKNNKKAANNLKKVAK